MAPKTFYIPSYLSLKHFACYCNCFRAYWWRHKRVEDQPGQKCLPPWWCSSHTWHPCRELTRIPNLWETKKIEKNTCQRKQLHAQDNIYVVQQFAYVYGVAGISLLSGKKGKYKVQVAAPIFLLTIKTRPYQNRNNQIAFSTQNGPKPPLHGLSLKRSPIKNYAILFGWVESSNRIKQN